MISFDPLICLTLPVAIAAGAWAFVLAGVAVASYFRFLSHFMGWFPRETMGNLHGDVVRVEQQLTALGFQFAGVAKFYVLFFRKQQYIAYYIDRERRVLAMLYPLKVLDDQYLLTFITPFQDTAIIITRSPYGMNILSPLFISTTASESVEQAYREHTNHVHHRQAVMEIAPVQIRDLAHIRHIEKAYDQFYKRRENRILYISLLLQSACMAIVSFAFLVLSGFVYPLTNGVGLFWFIVAVVALIAMVMISTFVGSKRQNQPKGKGKQLIPDSLW